MKKLRMVLTSVVVLTIVGSAFSFKAKIGRYCILDVTDSGNSCTTYSLANKALTTSDFWPAWKYYPNWDGDAATCTASNNHLCTVTVRLRED